MSSLVPSRGPYSPAELATFNPSHVAARAAAESTRSRPMTAHDAQLHAEAERRSVRARPEATLYDAVSDYLVRQCLVPAESISGVVIDGEVYELEATVPIYAVCWANPDDYPGGVHTHRADLTSDLRKIANDEASRAALSGHCGRVLISLRAVTPWGPA
jgi:hypothetical protein